MSDNLNFDGRKIDPSDLSENGQAILENLSYANHRIKELKNMQALLTRARNSYMSSLKQEILAEKAGIDLNEI